MIFLDERAHPNAVELEKLIYQRTIRDLESLC